MTSQPDALVGALLPCPFCGGPGAAEHGGPHEPTEWCGYCDDCGYSLEFRRTKQEAVAAWNARPLATHKAQQDDAPADPAKSIERRGRRAVHRLLHGHTVAVEDDLKTSEAFVAHLRAKGVQRAITVWTDGTWQEWGLPDAESAEAEADHLLTIPLAPADPVKGGEGELATTFWVLEDLRCEKWSPVPQYLHAEAKFFDRSGTWYGEMGGGGHLQTPDIHSARKFPTKDEAEAFRMAPGRDCGLPTDAWAAREHAMIALASHTAKPSGEKLGRIGLADLDVLRTLAERIERLFDNAAKVAGRAGFGAVTADQCAREADAVRGATVELTAAREVLSAPAETVGIPAGWKLVPVEPTVDMCCAPFDTAPGETDCPAVRLSKDASNEAVAEFYRALLNASPVAPAPAVDREAIARIIDPEGYWERLDNLEAAIRLGIATDDQHMDLCHRRDEEREGTRDSLAKADAILALNKGGAA
jgi:Lar family restriction alleviation protein